MIILKADRSTEAGVMPSEQLIADMTKYNRELANAGLLLAGEGLQASSNGARVLFSGAKRTVVDGPFPLPGLVAGFWIFQVTSKEEAIEWVKRCPNPIEGGDCEIEIRQIFEVEDFGDAATPEIREAEARLRAEIASRQ
jgi:hypothetical protein